MRIETKEYIDGQDLKRFFNEKGLNGDAWFAEFQAGEYAQDSMVTFSAEEYENTITENYRECMMALEEWLKEQGRVKYWTIDGEEVPDWSIDVKVWW